MKFLNLSLKIYPLVDRFSRIKKFSNENNPIPPHFNQLSPTESAG